MASDVGLSLGSETGFLAAKTRLCACQFLSNTPDVCATDCCLDMLAQNIPCALKHQNHKAVGADPLDQAITSRACQPCVDCIQEHPIIYHGPALWICCECGESGLVVGSSEDCPSCGHYRCSSCEYYKPKIRYDILLHTKVLHLLRQHFVA